MSERNIEITRRWVEAYRAHDAEEIIASCDPNVEFHSTFAAIGGAVYHGRDGMRRWLRDTEEVWGEAELPLDPEAYFDLGEYTLAFHVLRGRGKYSGVEVAM